MSQYKRDYIPSDLKALVWEMSQGNCWYCGVRLNPWRNYTIDHVTPLSRGGHNEIGNLVPCCRQCNTRKGSLTLPEWANHYRYQGWLTTMEWVDDVSQQWTGILEYTRRQDWQERRAKFVREFRDYINTHCRGATFPGSPDWDHVVQDSLS